MLQPLPVELYTGTFPILVIELVDEVAIDTVLSLLEHGSSEESVNIPST